jgi:hypothetical protein
MSDWLARGTQPICLNCREDDVRPLVKEGFKILEIFELSGVPGTFNRSPWLLSVANRAPHPKAAQVFANWILSKEGLEIYARGYGSATLRTDINESYLIPEIFPSWASIILMIRIGSGSSPAGTNRGRKFRSCSRRGESFKGFVFKVQGYTDRSRGTFNVEL